MGSWINRAAGARVRVLGAFALAALAIPAAHATAAHAAGRVIEAESMHRSDTKAVKKRTKRTASGRHALKFKRSPSSAYKQVRTRASNRLVLRARGDRCHGAPRAVVAIDGHRLARIRVARRSYRSKRVKVAVDAGRHKIRLSYRDRRKASRCSRHLYVDYLRLVDRATSHAHIRRAKRGRAATRTRVPHHTRPPADTAAPTQTPARRDVPGTPRTKPTPTPTRTPAPQPAPAPTRTSTPTPTPPPTTGPGSNPGMVIWGSTFEDGPRILGGLFKSSVRSESTAVMGSSTVLDDVATCYSGSHCLKVTQPAPTRTAYDDDIGRYQLAADTPSAVNGQDRWYGWAMQYAPGWDISQYRNNREFFLTTGGFRYTSTRANGPGGNLDAANNSADGDRVYWRSGINLSSTIGDFTVGGIWLGPVVVGQWVTFVQHVHWDSGRGGKVEWYRDGVKMGEYDGPTFGQTSAPTAELRFGIYEGADVSVDRSILYDNIRVGTSYAAVDPTR